MSRVRHLLELESVSLYFLRRTRKQTKAAVHHTEETDQSKRIKSPYFLSPPSPMQIPRTKLSTISMSYHTEINSICAPLPFAT